MFKKSFYNIYRENEEKKLCFVINTLTKSVLELEKEKLNALRSGKFEMLSSEEIFEFLEKGILVDSSVDETEIALHEYEQYCFNSTTVTLLIDFEMKPQVENALVEFVEKLLKETIVEKLRVFEHHLCPEKIPKEFIDELYKRLGELCTCFGVEYETGGVWEKDSDLMFCKGICPGKNRNFYRITPEGYISICVWSDEKEATIAHLLKDVDGEVAELCIRKDPFQDEDCRDCVYLTSCFGGRACDIEHYGRKRACQMVAENFIEQYKQ